MPNVGRHPDDDSGFIDPYLGNMDTEIRDLDYYKAAVQAAQNGQDAALRLLAAWRDQYNNARTEADLTEECEALALRELALALRKVRWLACGLLVSAVINFLVALIVLW